LRPGVTSKDIILAVIAKISTGVAKATFLNTEAVPLGLCLWKLA
jgi:homoaconitase/3-isopropylmalate dehydratase large subunit